MGLKNEEYSIMIDTMFLHCKKTHWKIKQKTIVSSEMGSI